MPVAQLWLAVSAIVLADTTDTLLPTADGEEDSADWSDTGGSACNDADCYTEVDEGTCDNDTSYIENSKKNKKQSFDIDESSIPDDSTITQIDISVCHKLVEAGAAYKARYCIDGSCTSGTKISSGASYANNTESFTGLSSTKSSSTDIKAERASTPAPSQMVPLSDTVAHPALAAPDGQLANQT